MIVIFAIVPLIDFFILIFSMKLVYNKYPQHIEEILNKFAKMINGTYAG